MGLFDFAREAGENLRSTLTGKHELEAQDLVQAIRAKGVTIDNGKITVKGDTVTITGEASSDQERELAVLILGNTKGVGKVDDQIVVRPSVAPASAVTSTPAAPPAKTTFYVVKSGDSLSKIAKQIYGDAGRYPEIFAANRPMLSDPDKIYPGQTLRIPS